MDPGRNIKSLQILRALAALLVVIWHSRLTIMHATRNYWADGDAAFRAAHYPAFLNHLDVGVDIFFCISGFIMSMLIVELRPSAATAWNFLARRILRIFPPYWVFTALVVAIYFASGGKLNIGFLSGQPAADFTKITTSLLLIPQGQPPVLGVGWTLIHEFLFYLLCALTVMIGLNRRLLEVLGCLSVLSLGLAALHVTVWFGYGLSTYNVEFLFGALAYRFGAFTGRRLPGLQLLAAVLGYVSVSWLLDRAGESSGPFLRQLGFGLTGFLLISGLRGLELKRGVLRSAAAAFFMRVGDASYTLYLSHWFVLSALGKILILAPQAPVYVLVVWQIFCVATAVVLALIMAEHAELPLHRRLARWFEGPKTEAGGVTDAVRTSVS